MQYKDKYLALKKQYSFLEEVNKLLSQENSRLKATLKITEALLSSQPKEVEIKETKPKKTKSTDAATELPSI